ncbi:MAG: TonB-dependent receptor plug domain-containing protein [Opitutales bacterium]
MKWLLQHGLAGALIAGAGALSAEPDRTGLEALTLNELLEVDVVTASKSSQTYLSTPAAVTVITGEELEQSTATWHVMDALRLVPGMHIFNLNNGRYLVGIRGFETANLNQTLVLKDGRSLNTPTLTGIYWNELTYPYDEIDRIEVIRGPGASVWGANAVNGVINIITKPAWETLGTRLDAGYGSDLAYLFAGRHGGYLEDLDLYYRGSLAYRFRNDSDDDHTTVTFEDEIEDLRGSFRFDGESDDLDTLYSISLDAYRQNYEERFRRFDPDNPAVLDDALLNNENYGVALTGTWERYLSHNEKLFFRSYFQHDDRTLGELAEISAIVGDFQGEFSHEPIDGHNFLWTAEYRIINESIDDSTTFDFDASNYTRHLVAVSLQDDIELLPDQLFVTTTAKLEYHNLTGPEFLGSLRLRYLPSQRQTFWSSVSRAVRTPSLAETNHLARLPDDLTGLQAVYVQPDDELNSPESLSFQAGARRLLTDKLLAETSGFYTRYEDLINAEFRGVGTNPDRLITQWANNRDGATYGVEVALDYRPHAQWRLRGNLSWMRHDLESVEMNGVTTVTERNDDRLFANVILDVVPHERLTTSVVGRYVSDIQTNNNFDFPAYFEIDTSLRWQATDHLRLSLIGRNLLDPERPEYRLIYTQFQPTVVERSFFLQATVEF